jgi:hypothetical protein
VIIPRFSAFFENQVVLPTKTKVPKYRSTHYPVLLGQNRFKVMDSGYRGPLKGRKIEVNDFKE